MSAIEDLEYNGELLDQAGSLLLQLVAAVDYLRRGFPPGFTVWDAFEEALRWHANSVEDWTAADPLGRVIRSALAGDGQVSTAETFNIALRRWAETTAAVYNSGLTWELSTARQGPADA